MNGLLGQGVCPYKDTSSVLTCIQCLTLPCHKLNTNE